jgi:hypothetical protein
MRSQVSHKSLSNPGEFSPFNRSPVPQLTPVKDLIEGKSRNITPSKAHTVRNPTNIFNPQSPAPVDQYIDQRNA